MATHETSDTMTKHINNTVQYNTIAYTMDNIAGLVHDCSKSNALAMELL